MTFGQFYVAAMIQLETVHQMPNVFQYVGSRQELVDIIHDTWKNSRRVDNSTIRFAANLVFNDEKIHGIPPVVARQLTQS